MSVKKYEMDMCSGSILGKMLLFTLPLMASSVLQLLFNAADVIVVGRFAGNNALAAVGSNGSLINLLTNFFMGLSIGVNVLVARFYAAQKEEEVKNTVHTAMLLALCSGVFLTIVGCAGARTILTWMKTPADILELSTQYLRIYFLGMTSMMLYNFGSAILRAIGDTRRPLYYLSGAGIINVVLNLIFVIGFKMSVAGVALATVISQTISAILIVRCLLVDDGCIRLEFSQLRMDKDVFLRILRIGLPASLQGILFSFSNVVIQTSINEFGEVVVAGNSAAANIEGFVYVAMNAVYQATISFVSQNMGAAKYDRIHRILITAECCVLVIGLTLGNLTVFFGNELLGLYSESEAVVAEGMERMRFICGTYALCGVMEVFVGALRGLGYAVLPMLVSLIGACGLRLIWIFTFFRTEQFHTTQSLYMTYPVSWMVTAVAHFLCYLIITKKVLNNYEKSK